MILRFNILILIKRQPLPLIGDDNGEEYGGGENNIVHGIQKLGEH